MGTRVRPLVSDDFNGDRRLDLAVTDKVTGECLGEAVLNQWDPGNESCNFRIFIGPKGRGRGLGTEATRLIVGYGFEHLGLHRISLEVYAFNPRARRSLVRLSLSIEWLLKSPFKMVLNVLPPCFGTTFITGPSALTSAETPVVCSTISWTVAALIW